MKKRDINDIDKQIKQLINDCVKNELPRSKTRNRRNGNQLPLTGWMAGAPSGVKSKILAVAKGYANYGYCTLSAGSFAIVDRIAKKYPITELQYDLLRMYIFRFYRGHNRTSYLDIPNYVLNTKSRDCGGVGEIIREICGYKVPLRLILSEELTNLILLKTLINTAKGAKK